MAYAGVIFDLDGVICTTDHYHYLAWKTLADRLGIPFSEEENNHLRGISRLESLNILLRKSNSVYTEAQRLALADEKNQYYQKLLAGMSAAELSAEVKATLDQLRSRGLKLAIGSSSRNAPIILERLGLSDYFDAVADGNGISRSKPDPEVFLKAADMLLLSPAQCLVVEDAHAGVQAAAAGGFDCAAMGDARDDTRARYQLTCFADLLSCVD